MGPRVLHSQQALGSHLCRGSSLKNEGPPAWAACACSYPSVGLPRGPRPGLKLSNCETGSDATTTPPWKGCLCLGRTRMRQPDH